MPDEIKRIDIKEFREFGFLQEANRLFFHPLGLALEIKIEDDGAEKLGGIWDYRDNLGGITFADLSDSKDAEKARRVSELLADKSTERNKILGYIIQPIGNKQA